jgi:hypothetical protein
MTYLYMVEWSEGNGMCGDETGALAGSNGSEATLSALDVVRDIESRGHVVTSLVVEVEVES